MTAPETSSDAAANPTESAWDAAGVRAALGLGDDYREWTERLAAVADAGPVDIPAPGPARKELYDRIEVPQLDRADLDAALLEANAPGSALRWLLERTAAALIATRGELGWIGTGPDLPAELGAPGRYFYVHVCLAAVPAVRAYHRELGVPDDVSWSSLADLGNKIGVYRRTFGLGGFDKQMWMALPFRGILYRLGRLQFNLGTHPGGEHGLAAHIPEGGAMDPAACDASFDRAGAFFTETFPDFFRDLPGGGKEGVRVSCHSWLLDPQLAEYLPAESNIIRFQRRWTRPDDEPLHVSEPDEHGLTGGDRGIVEFVFRRMVTTPEEIAALDARSTLERAVLAHLAAGRHWQGGHGYVTV